MTNIFKGPKKVELKYRLFEIGVVALQNAGWTVTKEKGLGKSSVRRITKGKESLLASIRTTQDQWIAFPPKPEGGWVTLDEVDVVVAVSVDANIPPQEALVHWLPGEEMRKRFNEAFAARKKAGHEYPKPNMRRGLWVPLYIRDDGATARFAGGGAGLDHPEIARVRLDGEPPRHPSSLGVNAPPPMSGGPGLVGGADGDPRSAIADAKRRLSAALGVSEDSIRIIIEA